MGLSPQASGHLGNGGLLRHHTEPEPVLNFMDYY